MLKTIKSMIEQKEEFLESAAVIYEDVMDDIEKYITEDEDGDDIVLDDTDTKDPETIEPVKTQPVEDDTIEDKSAEDLTDICDLLNVTIDSKTNTLTDVLPVPPVNAKDVIISNDILDAEIDDGFTEASTLALSEEEYANLLCTNYNDDKSYLKDIQNKLINGQKLTVREAAIFRLSYKNNGKGENVGYILLQNHKGKKLPADIFTESINIDAADTSKTDDSINKDAATDDGKVEDTNDLTNTVIDKVNDVESTPVADDPADAKMKLMDKLDKLNKGILDLKENIKKHI
jgi:hypothetical protein